MQEAQIWSLVGKLRSHMLHSAAKKTQKTTKISKNAELNAKKDILKLVGCSCSLISYVESSYFACIKQRHNSYMHLGVSVNLVPCRAKIAYISREAEKKNQWFYLLTDIYL